MRAHTRAAYTYTVHGTVIAIVDQGSGRSVTNDADNVVDDLARAGFDLDAHRIIYRDTRGVWDQLVTEGGRFKDFRSINVRSLDEALARISAVPAAGGAA